MNQLIRRAAPGVALAGAALSVVWLFDPAFDDDTDTTASTGSSAPTSSALSDEAGAGTDTGSTNDSGTSTKAPSAASADCSDTTTASGDAVDTQWGPVQVQVEFAADGTICSVEAIAYPQGDPHSARINAVAIPKLDAQAAEVGIQFDAISGATFTSEAYRDSMQSILDSR
ncbi:MAG: FMN-binding protein [Candidatus Nanopelagicales bacterium]